MTDWQAVFAKAGLSLELLEVDLNTGELTVVPMPAEPIEKTDGLGHTAARMLTEFFAHHGLELRDVDASSIARKPPLNSLVKLSAQLVPSEPVTPLGEVLTSGVVEALKQATNPISTTFASATVEPLYWEGIFVNWCVTLRPLEGAKPFRASPGGDAGKGTCESPRRLADGSYAFVTATPFDLSDVPTEAEIAAVQIGAVLMECVSSTEAP